MPQRSYTLVQKDGTWFIRGASGPVAVLKPLDGVSVDEAFAEVVRDLLRHSRPLDCNRDRWDGWRGHVKLVDWAGEQRFVLRADRHGTRIELFRNSWKSTPKANVALLCDQMVARSTIPLPDFPRRMTAREVRDAFWRHINPWLALPFFRGIEDPALVALSRPADTAFLETLVVCVLHARGLPTEAGSFGVTLPVVPGGDCAVGWHADGWNADETDVAHAACEEIRQRIRQFPDRLRGACGVRVLPPSPTIQALMPISHLVVVDPPSAAERASARRRLATGEFGRATAGP
jgi:hypothetical protein